MITPRHITAIAMTWVVQIISAFAILCYFFGETSWLRFAGADKMSLATAVCFSLTAFVLHLHRRA